MNPNKSPDIENKDPVDFLIEAGDSGGRELNDLTPMRIPLICAANDKRPGGDWETAGGGYEERLCRRSNLSATLGASSSSYPIMSQGGIISKCVGE
jgi:hypothetical protein